MHLECNGVVDRLTVEPRSWAQIWFRSGIVQDYVVFPTVHGFVYLECNCLSQCEKTEDVMLLCREI